MEPRERNATLIELRRALDQLSESSQTADDATASQTSTAASEIGDLLSGVAELAHQLGVDPEETLRHRASLLAEVIKDFEAQH
jgi:uncharacterized protein YabN with tetrapyrrole methylase and pyrophosphatase domain